MFRSLLQHRVNAVRFFLGGSTPRFCEVAHSGDVNAAAKVNINASGIRVPQARTRLSPSNSRPSLFAGD